MNGRVVLAEGLPAAGRDALTGRADWLLDYRSPARNARFDFSDLPLPAGPERARALDLLDLAATVYLADLTLPRGLNEDWVRDLELCLPVRCPDFWSGHAALVESLLQRLTGDNLRCDFLPRVGEDPPAGGEAWIEADCVCLVSGGLDSAAGAVGLLRTGRSPRLVLHRSGNPVALQAQEQVLASLQSRWPDQFRPAVARLAPSSHRTGALPFPPPERRESSRRSRSFLFMVLGAVAALGEEVHEVYLYDNALLSSGVPLTEARTGGFTTHSTHPAVLADFNALLAAAGWPVSVLNPFLYSAKGELIRDFLAPVLSPREIAATVSCWALGRRERQCGVCVPCLLRRISLLAAGLPDEVYEVDLLASPRQYAGTDGYRNLVDLLTWATRVLSTPEVQIPLLFPSLLEVHDGGASLKDLVHALRRQATEIFTVVHQRFPAAAELLYAPA